MNLRRISGAVAVALASTVLLAPQAQAANGTLFTCSDYPGGAVYEMVGGAPIWVQAQEYGALIAGGAAAPGAQTCGASHAPSDGAVAQSTVGGAPQHTFVIVGGAPIEITDWNAFGGSAPANLQYFDQASLPPASPPAVDDVTAQPNGSALAGYLGTVARSRPGVAASYFRDESTGTVYRLDSNGHPTPAATVPSGAVVPVIPDSAVAACTRMVCAPWGDITATVVGTGRIRVNGWALAAKTTQPVTVHFAGGGRSYDIAANQPAPDINSGFDVAGDHGFDRVLSVPAGHYTLCTTFNAPDGTSALEGCQVVDVPGTKPNKVHRPKIKAKGHGVALIKWKAPNAHGSQISTYVVHTNVGKKRQVSGRVTHLKLKHLAGKHLVVKVRAMNEAGLGPYSKKSKMVRIR